VEEYCQTVYTAKMLTEKCPKYTLYVPEKKNKYRDGPAFNKTENKNVKTTAA